MRAESREQSILGAGYTCVDLWLVFREEPGHPKVTYFWDPLLIKENIAGLDVPVNDTARRILMQVQQPPCHPHYDFMSPLPIQLPTLSFVCIQPSIQLTSTFFSIILTVKSFSSDLTR